MQDIIRIPHLPKGIADFSRYPSLKANWEYSRDKLRKLSHKLTEAIKTEEVSIVVAGSYGRLEASSESDLDYIVLTNSLSDETKQIQSTIIKLAAELNILLPNPTGVFSVIIPVNELIERTGRGDDDLASLAQRMLLLMEARPVYNEHLYRSTVDKLLRKYLRLLEGSPEKEALFLLNDIIRYFRSICVNYEFNFWKQEDKWVIRNVKLRHSRIVMYAGLLLLTLNASKYRSEQKTKFSYIAEHTFLTPIEKIVSVYQDNGDPSYRRVLGIYDIFTRKISDPTIRQALKADYEERYSNPYYSELKVNSDSLQTELSRFIFAQKGRWTDQIFEYLLFLTCTRATRRGEPSRTPLFSPPRRGFILNQPKS